MKPITPDSLYDIIHIDELAISPDGSRLAFVRASIDRSGNAYVRNVWLKDLTDPRRPAEPLTSGGRDGAPRWSSDGTRLAFLSGRDEKPAVYVLPMSGGEARSLATHPNGIGAFEWSPDGRRIAYTARMRRDECEDEDRMSEEERQGKAEGEGRMAEGGDGSKADDGKPTIREAWDLKRDKDQKQHDEELRLDPRVISRVPYRTGTTFVEDRFAHLYLIDVPDSFARTNEARPMRITPDDCAANFAAPQWSPDGRFLYSSYSRDPDSGELFRYADIVRIDTRVDRYLAASFDARRFVRMPVTDYTCSDPLPSPDGAWLAFERSFDDPEAYQPGTLAIMPAGAGGGEVRNVTGRLDRSLAGFRWSPDSRFLYFTLIGDGAVNLWRVRVGRRVGAPEPVMRAVHEINAFDVLPDGGVVFAASTARDPSALYSASPRGRFRPLERPNRGFLAEHAVGKVEAVRYPSDGRVIHGWLIKPADFDPRHRYPLIVQMHGGPHVMWGAGTRSIWHEFQAMVGAGYLVFYCNPRGSDGYGRAFWHANRGDWGDGPMNDVLRGVEILGDRDYIDGRRICLTGGSYAGYLTAWMIGRDHRFAAACAQRGVYNLVSMRNTTDIPFFNDREAGGLTPWDDVEALWKMSPISLVPNMRTPLLIEHSEQDFRVPIEQAEQLFQAMRLMKKTVELVRWPREGHELSRTGEPRHRAERIRRIIGWFNTHSRQGNE
jgi:dipeptidyl aminopeptidase/acylaminoacyl peptidase